MSKILDLWRKIDGWMFAPFDRRPDLTLRGGDDIRQALNFGTTLTTRLWLSLFSLGAAAQVILQSEAMQAKFFLWEVPSYGWASALLVAGVLMLWRVVSPKSRPVWGWLSNGLTTTVWGFVMWSKMVEDGPQGLLGYYTFVWLMAAWVFIRTGATRRDMETT